MKLRQTAALALIPAALALAACEPTNPTSPGSCNGRIDGRTVEKVIVPQGATCVLENTRVQANVEVKRDTTLIARGARIGGNIQAENHREVRVGRSTTVGGSVQLEQGKKVSVRDTRVTGDIQYDANSGPLDATGNRVNGNIQIVGNRGSNEIRSNRVGGNLQCKENSPPPTGGGNIVDGNKEDQCRRL
ncbi:hypothetical protein BH20ACT3_BH20ACT3_16820 [soil metagenome]